MLWRFDRPMRTVGGIWLSASTLLFLASPRAGWRNCFLLVSRAGAPFDLYLHHSVHFGWRCVRRSTNASTLGPNGGGASFPFHLSIEVDGPVAAKFVLAKSAPISTTTVTCRSTIGSFPLLGQVPEDGQARFISVLSMEASYIANVLERLPSATHKSKIPPPA